MRRKTIGLDDALYDYVVATTLRDDDILARLREETATLEWGRMQIAPEQGQFMAMLTRLVQARKAIEVGVFTGYSGLSVARALPEDGRLVACDVSEEWTALGRRFWAEAGVAHKIDLRLAPAAQTLQGLIDGGESGTWDFAFIDADKSNYPVYYEQVLTLLRPGGLVVVDNTLWSGRVTDETDQSDDTIAIRRLNDTVRDDPRVSMSLVPIGDGALLARKR